MRALSTKETTQVLNNLSLFLHSRVDNHPKFDALGPTMHLSINMSQASLLGLPPSLPSRIYDKLLAGALVRLPDNIAEIDGTWEHDHLPSSGKGVRNVWAYLEICRTMHEEMKPLFFSETAFMIDKTTWDLNGLLEIIGPEAIDRLRKVAIRCEGRCRDYVHHTRLSASCFL